ncbi:unnamed protein product [Adineta ricciae]|uniref:Uncharacterized protein n=1 Tax=Adineta ricciae TaxID=249248 RepID=A0A815NYD5_ADIRI|nr:unnamed protein product [Adineta ricciae]
MVILCRTSLLDFCIVHVLENFLCSDLMKYLHHIEFLNLPRIFTLTLISEVVDRRTIILDKNEYVEQVIGNNAAQPAIGLVDIPPDTSTPSGIRHWTTPNGDSLQNTLDFN